MADIRLKKITIEPTEILTIQKGNISITNTTISNNRLNGTLVINGGLGINCTHDSISSTSGGALTIGGGLSVQNKAFFGNDVIMDNNTKTLSLNGIDINRFFVDSISNKYIYFSPDGISKRFELFDTRFNINITTPSTNASTGALIINGGISINSTTNAINSSNGGGLTIAGGLSVGRNTFLSDTLTLGRLYSNNRGLLIKYTGSSQIGLENSSGSSITTLNMENNNFVISSNSDILFNTTNGNFIFSNLTTNNTLLTIYDKSSRFHKFVEITDTVESLNMSTASLIITGGLTVKCTTDAMSSSNGGGLSINGGMAITKKTVMGDTLGIEVWNNNKSNKIILYQEQQNLTEGNIFTGLGVTTGSLRFQIHDTNKDFTFLSSSTNGISTEVFTIKGTNEVQFMGMAQKYSFLAGGNTNKDLSIQSQSLAEPSSICFFTKDGDKGDINDIKIFGLGTPNNVSNSEYLQVGWNTSDYIIGTIRTGTGTAGSLVLQSITNNNQVRLITDGSVSMSSTKASINSTTGGLVLFGGLGITTTADSASLTNGGALTIRGGASIARNVRIGNTLNLFSTGGNISFYAQNTRGDLIITNPTNRYILAGNSTSASHTNSLGLFSLNHTKTGNFEVIELSCNATSSNGIYIINSTAGGTGILRPLQINVGTNVGMFMNTNGNMGINTTTPNFQLDINGTMRANNYNFVNQLTIYNTSPATNELTSGSLTVAGGTSISRNLFVGGSITCIDSTNAVATSASVYLNGGLTIATNQTSNFGSGALTVNGGGYIGGELYVQQNLIIQGTSSISSLRLTSTRPSINASTGTLLSFGGITIQNTTNSLNISNGGSFLTNGGASIGRDIYVGGNIYNYGIQDFYNNTEQLINFYDTFNFKRFSIDRNTSTNDFSVSLYNNSGNFVEKSIEISNSNGQIKFNNSRNSTNFSSGSLITLGGITIQTTMNSTNLQNGGALTVFGGSSISKDMYVGGNVNILSTTNSTNSNEGALKVSGGVGITGNLNILGNMVVTGNVSIIGTTNSISSTNTLLSDNILVINSGPAGSADGGVLIQRFQQTNDTGNGDVVNDLSNQHETYTLPNQSGMTTTQLKLPMTSNNNDNFYEGWWIKITSGFNVNQVRKISGYVASTRILTIENTWTNQNPNVGDTVHIYNKPYVGLFWNENIDTFQLGSTVKDPSNSSISLTEYNSLELGSLIIQDTISSTSVTQGAVILNGGLSIKCSTQATSLSSGGAVTIAGGASISKNLYVGDKLYVAGIDITPNQTDQIGTTSFTAANNVTSQNIPNLNFDGSVWGYDLFLSARLIATNNQYSNYHLRAVNRGTTWEIISNYVGDSILSFNITNSGQLQYSTPNFPGFSSLIFKYKIFTN